MSSTFDRSLFYQNLDRSGTQVHVAAEEEIRLFPGGYHIEPNLPESIGLLEPFKAAAKAGQPTIIMRATQFSLGSGIEVSTVGYGDVIHNGYPHRAKPNAAEWDFDVKQDGWYRLVVEYAAAESRPCKISLLIGGNVSNCALAATTGGWYLPNQQWNVVRNVYLRKGNERIRISRPDVFPHIRTIVFYGIGS